MSGEWFACPVVPNVDASDCLDCCCSDRRANTDCGRQQAAPANTSFEVDARTVYEAALTLLLRKHHDYGPANIAQSPGGPLNGLRVRMWDKLARINHLVDSGVDPANESLRDSFVDMLNYAAIGLLVLDGKWPQ